MDAELSSLTSFLATYLPPSPSTTTFLTSLTTFLHESYDEHWHPDSPEQGSAYRCLTRSFAAGLDSRIARAANLDGSVGLHELVECLETRGDGKVALGERWTIWVDPGCVSLRLEDASTSSSSSSSSIFGNVDGAKNTGTTALITIYGSLHASLAHLPSISLANFLAQSSSSTASLNTAERTPSPTLLPSLLLSPTKRSRAIQILKPPAVTPPTPLRPTTPTPGADVFSSPTSALTTTSSSTGLTVGAATANGASPYSHLSATATLRRPSSRTSSNASSSSASSTDELDIFSSTDSLSTTLSSVSLATTPNEEFKVPALPTYAHGLRPKSSNSSLHAAAAAGAFAFPPHPRPSSAASNHSHSSSTGNGMRSVPSSPSKPRRRGTRGGGGGHGGSVSSLASATGDEKEGEGEKKEKKEGSRTREMALQGVLTEHSGGKVGVLSGGCLLGLAGASKLGSARGEVIGEARRRGRERKRVHSNHSKHSSAESASSMGAGVGYGGWGYPAQAYAPAHAHSHYPQQGYAQQQHAQGQQQAWAGNVQAPVFMPRSVEA
ncbi:anti-proliferative protein domain containing protein [Pseudohyphozyma bogoriensis]|nr:anti-proliferative protein domain containing protein [Pseudohyphozyma bogoriensis]